MHSSFLSHTHSLSLSLSLSVCLYLFRSLLHLIFIFLSQNNKTELERKEKRQSIARRSGNLTKFTKKNKNKGTFLPSFLLLPFPSDSHAYSLTVLPSQLKQEVNTALCTASVPKRAVKATAQKKKKKKTSKKETAMCTSRGGYYVTQRGVSNNAYDVLDEW